jgi:hypothetical protein
MRLLLVLLVSLGSATSVLAQASKSQPPPPPPRPPAVIVLPPVYTPPQPPHERTYVQPDSRAPPMQRLDPLPQMAPRVGN